MKFGGSCLRDYLSLDRVREIVEMWKNQTIIVSALSGITDYLNSTSSLDMEYVWKRHEIKFKNSLLKERYKKELMEKASRLSSLYLKFNIEHNQRIKAEILSYGERLSALMLKFYLLDSGKDSEVFDSDRLGIVADGQIMNSTVDLERSRSRVVLNLKDISEDKILIITGFFAINSHEEVCLLGRNGSDVTAAAIASILNCRNVTFYKDVPGLMNAPPEIVEYPQKMKKVDYLTAYRMARLGAKIVNPLALKMLWENGITAEIRGMYSEFPDTIISVEAQDRIFGINLMNDAVLVKVNVERKKGLDRKITSISKEFSIVGWYKEKQYLTLITDRNIEEKKNEIFKLLGEPNVEYGVKVASIVYSGGQMKQIINEIIETIGREYGIKPRISKDAVLFPFKGDAHPLIRSLHSTLSNYANDSKLYEEVARP